MTNALSKFLAARLAHLSLIKCLGRLQDVQAPPQTMRPAPKAKFKNMVFEFQGRVSRYLFMSGRFARWSLVLVFFFFPSKINLRPLFIRTPLSFPDWRNNIVPCAARLTFQCRASHVWTYFYMRTQATRLIISEGQEPMLWAYTASQKIKTTQTHNNEAWKLDSHKVSGLSWRISSSQFVYAPAHLRLQLKRPKASNHPEKSITTNRSHPFILQYMSWFIKPRKYKE